MRVLSLFSGVGGFDMGLEAAGMTTAFQCEIDTKARQVLDYHWPDVPKWDDVSTLTGAHILAVTGGVDVVAWGSPCQDLSVAGKRAGLSGERSGLFHEGIRIIKELRELSNGKYPTWSIWENVVGALSSNRGADFGQVLSEMDEAGACFSEWTVLDAQYFGVPQRRRRVFVTSCFDPATSERCGEPLFPVSESLPGHLTKGAASRKGTSGAVEDSVGAGGTGDGYTDNNGVLRGTVTSKWHKGSGGPVGDEAYNLVVEPVTYAKSRRAQSTEDAESWIESDVTPTLNVFDVGDTRATTAIIEPIPIHDQATRFAGKRDSKQDGKGNGLGVENPGDPMNTLTQGDRHAVAYEEPLLLDGRRVDDVRVYTEPVQTLQERMGTGGNNVPVVAQEPFTPVGYAEYTAGVGTLKASGGDLGGGSETIIVETTTTDNGSKLLGSDITGPLAARDYKGVGSQYLNENKIVIQDPIVFQPGGMSRLGGHVWDGGPVPTLRAESHRGDNEPHIVQDSLSFDTQFGSNANVFEDQAPTLKASQQPPSVTVGAVSYDGYNQQLWQDIHVPLRTQRDASDFVANLGEPSLIVRRLTPLECERLMGWPDNHTATGTNGPISDTNRYKMCGNGVASPVAKWIGKHILNV